MLDIVPQILIALAAAFPRKLYIVGGAVRDHLAGLSPERIDWDICSPVRAEEAARIAAALGFTVVASYPATGSLKLRHDGADYEFTSFRTDSYSSCGHRPRSVSFTDDIKLDAGRRDFTCNAVYFDISSGKIVDPLGGAADIAAKFLRPCAPPSALFAEDAVRILRLARFYGELGFGVDDECVAAARLASPLLSDLPPSWLWREFSGILAADEKYAVAGGCGRALGLLHSVGALNKLFPALCADGAAPSSAIAAAGAAPEKIRLAALLYSLGGRGAEEALRPYPLPKAELHRCVGLISSLRRLQHSSLPLRHVIQQNADCMAELCALAAAVGEDGSAWLAEYAAMQAEGAPLKLSDLNVRGDQLRLAGIPPAMIGSALGYLLKACADRPELNCREKLLALASDFIEN